MSNNNLFTYELGGYYLITNEDVCQLIVQCKSTSKFDGIMISDNFGISEITDILPSMFSPNSCKKISKETYDDCIELISICRNLILDIIKAENNEL